MINTSIHFILPDDSDPTALTGDVTIKFDYAVDEDFKWYGGHIKINGSSTNSHKIIFTNTHTNRRFGFEDVSFYSQGCQFAQAIWFSNSYVNCDGSTFYTFEGVGTTGVLQNISITNKETNKKAISLGWGSYITLRGSFSLKSLSAKSSDNDSAVLWVSFSSIVITVQCPSISNTYRAGLRLRGAEVRGYDSIIQTYKERCTLGQIVTVGTNVLNLGNDTNAPILSRPSGSEITIDNSWFKRSTEQNT